MKAAGYSTTEILGKVHLYAGLFVSPFVLLYALTAIMFNHQLGTNPDDYTSTGRAENIEVTVDQSLENLPLAQSITEQLGLHGEIDNIWRNVKTLNMPVSRPGETDIVRVDLANSTASVEYRKTGISAALLYLHSRPGPHVTAIRGNWFWIRAWRLMADITVYILIFLTISGPAVWLAMKQNNRTGLMLSISGLAATAIIILMMTI